MTKIDDLFRNVGAAFAALLLSTVAIGAAVGPAEAVGPGEIVYAAAHTVGAHG